MNAHISAAAIQADNKIVVAGSALIAPQPSGFALARYNSDGTLDGTFGNNGITITGMGAGAASAWGVGVQTDGKIVAGGYAVNGGKYVVALMRYLADGTPDTAFGASGKVMTQIGSNADYGNALALLPDGKIIVAGQTMGTTWDYALIRYNQDGSLDADFGVSGKVITAVGSNTDWANRVVLQPDNKILVAGSSTGAANNYDISLVRYNPDGSLDTSFNGTGKVTTPVGSGSDYGVSLALQSNGKIVVAGSASNGTNDDGALVRYNADGSLDTSFNGTGKVTTAVGPKDDYFNDVVMQPDGKIVVAGSSSNGTDDDVALVRFLP